MPGAPPKTHGGRCVVLADTRPRSAEPQAGRHPSAARGGTPPGRPGPRGDARWADTAALALGLLAGLYGLYPLLRGAGWWFGGAAIVLLVLGVAALVRRSLGRGWAPPLAGALAGALTITPVFGGGTGFLGVLPTGETWDAFATLVRRGMASIQEQSIPADAVPGIMLLLVLPLVVIAAAADAIVLEAELPVLGALPLLALLVVPVAIRGGISDGYAWLLVLASWLLLIRRGLPGVPRMLSLATGAAVALGSLGIPLLLPAVTATPQDLAGLGTRANPIINLGTDLRRASPVTVLTYRSRGGVMPYLRLATLSDFSGRTWAPDESLGNRTFSLQDVPPAQGLESTVKRSTRQVSISVAGVGGRWLPLPYPVTAVTGQQGDWAIEPEGLTARTASGGADGQRYTATFIDIAPTAAQLAASGTSRLPGMQRYLALPSGIDPIVQRTALRITRSAGTNYAKAVAMQDYFRSQFAYSEQAPVDQGYDGSGVGVLGKFLKVKAGYCVQFASTMAVMSRQLGIPARVVVGYLPGETDTRNADGSTTYKVTSRNLHAWPELYFPGVGWTRFEPTASLGTLPAYSLPSAAQPTAAPTDAPSAAPSAAPTAAPTATPTPRAQRDPGALTPSAPLSGAVPVALGWAGGLAAVLLALLVPAAVRRGIRLARYSRVDSGRGGAEAAWAELRDTARDLGWAAPPTETVREFAERLEFALLEDADAVGRVRAAVETEAYARWRGTGVDASDLRVIVAALLRTVPVSQRLRATLLPASLLERVTAVERA